MRSFVSDLFKTKLTAGILLLLMGGILIFTPTGALATAVRIAGVIFAIGALVGFLIYFLFPDDRKHVLTLILSVLAVIMAVVFLAAPAFVSGVLPFVFGLILLLNSVGDFFAAFSLPAGRVIAALIALAGIVLGVVILCNPASLGKIITRLVGLSLALSGAGSVVSAVLVKKNS